MKKRKIIILTSAILLLLLALLLVIVNKAKENKTLKIGFVDLPETVQISLEEKIKEFDKENIIFSTLTSSEFESAKLKKYDYIFSIKGNALSNRKDDLYDFSEDYFEEFPSSIQNSERKYLPLLLDHYGMNYNRNFFNEENFNYPRNFVELQNYLLVLKSYVFIPFFCAGGEDKNLLALISAFTEALGGSLAYQNLLEIVNEDISFTEKLNKELYIFPETNNILSLKTILDGIKSWQKEEIFHPNWYQIKDSELKLLLEMNQIGVFFTSLSNQRKVDSKLLRDFDTDRFPVLHLGEAHGVIQPLVVCAKTSKKEIFSEEIKELVSQEIQYYLSVKTKLAPVNSFSKCYDKQADDVRFLAAACSQGPMPDIYNGAFQGKDEAAHKFAEEVRDYLKKAEINN